MENKEILISEIEPFVKASMGLKIDKQIDLLIPCILKSMDLARKDTAKEYEQKLSEAQAEIENLRKSIFDSKPPYLQLYQDAKEEIDRLKKEVGDNLTRERCNLLEQNIGKLKAEIERLEKDKETLLHQLKTDYIKEFVSRGGKLSELQSPSPDAVGKAIEAMQKFVDKVDRGLARSVDSYRDFKEAITLLQSAKSDAVEFAEWIIEKRYLSERILTSKDDKKMWMKQYTNPSDRELLTSQELYTIFQKSKDA